MVSREGVFAAEDKPFELKYLIENFKAQHNDHCHKLGITINNNIGLQLMKQNTKRPFPHYRIACGEDFTSNLVDFFKSNGVTVHNSKSNAIYIKKAELNNPKLTYQAAHQFLFDLNQTIRNVQAQYAQKQSVTVTQPRI